jgi:hypothetical protein
MISLVTDRRIYGNNARVYLERIIDRSIEDRGCWICLGQHNSTGVALIKIKNPRTNLVVARLIWEIFNPEFDYFKSENRILHSCDNDRCWNLNHLREGSYHENMIDMYAKGRHRRIQPNERFR